jgi:hypothetical protein
MKDSQPQPQWIATTIWFTENHHAGHDDATLFAFLFYCMLSIIPTTVFVVGAATATTARTDASTSLGCILNLHCA